MPQPKKPYTPPPPVYRYPDIATWAAYVETCENLETLNNAVGEFKSARSRSGVHPFYDNKQTGLAIWHLDQRAEKLGFYKVSDGTYRKSSTAHIK